MLRELLKFKNGKSLDIKFPITILDKNNNEIYHEDSKGYSWKKEFDDNNNELYYEVSSGYSCKKEFDKKSNK